MPYLPTSRIVPPPASSFSADDPIGFIPLARVAQCAGICLRTLVNRINDEDPERRIPAFRLMGGKRMYLRTEDIQKYLFVPVVPLPRELRVARGSSAKLKRTARRTARAPKA